jgi:hypothetical protein
MILGGCATRTGAGVSAPSDFRVYYSHVELMDIQAVMTARLFARLDGGKPFEPGAIEIVEAGAAIEVIATRLRGLYGFNNQGMIDLERTGRELASAGRAKNESAVRVALTTMRQTCRACHERERERVSPNPLLPLP